MFYLEFSIIFCDISAINVSEAMINKITDNVLPIALEWQNRPLNTVYLLIFIDYIQYNVKDSNMFNYVPKTEKLCMLPIQ
ncbi:transposase [Mycoplasma sp. P36-A1]|uniref:transposase n=1 Tax=Mycoplasma sp. P36-A1 TaxID=3252900 RepID=UPI003C2AFBAA